MLQVFTRLSKPTAHPSGEVPVLFFVVGAVFGEVQVSLFVAGAALGEGLNVRLGAKRCILQ